MSTTRTRTNVRVFVNRKPVTLDVDELTGAQLLELAKYAGTDWDLLRLHHGEGDPSGGELVMADQILHLHEGDRFRAIPGNRTFGGDDARDE